MKLVLSNAKPTIDVCDPTISLTPINFDDYRRLPERISKIDVLQISDADGINSRSLFAYRVFPNRIMVAWCQWKIEGREMRIGDHILQRVFIPPIGLGLCMDFLVRIHTLIVEPNRLGFSYVTLDGHPESGCSEFYYQRADGRLEFVIHTFSTPKHGLARLFASAFSLPYQSYCTRAALRHVKMSYTPILAEI